MKHPLPYAVLLLVCGLTAAAGRTPPAPDLHEAMTAAARAYDHQQFEEAARIYAALIDEGHALPALYFNLGNVHYRQRQPGRAVWAYRRAWRLAPRDPDIQANLRRTMLRAGAAPPDPPPLVRLVYKLTPGEWTALTVAAYWLAALCGGLWLSMRKPLPGRLALAMLLAALFGVAVLAARGWMERHPEAVIVQPGVTALFAPLPGTTEHFTLPEGSVVRLRENAGDWRRIEHAGREGWIPAHSARTVPGM